MVDGETPRFSHGQGILGEETDEFDDIWPLQLIDLRDDEQFDLLYRLLRFSPLVIQHYLYEFVFPEVMRFQGLKISACGQSLGGEILFEQRLCFSGTPSSLIP